VLELNEAEALIRSHRLDGQRARSALEDGWLSPSRGPADAHDTLDFP
jgi:hypothetical protein